MLTKRYTIYFEPTIHRVLKLMSVETDQSISEIVNEAIRNELAQDQDDLETFAKRAKEQTISYEALLKKLKADGKI